MHFPTQRYNGMCQATNNRFLQVFDTLGQTSAEENPKYIAELFFIFTSKSNIINKGLYRGADSLFHFDFLWLGS